MQEPGKEAVDCSACGSSGFPISGDLNLLDNTIITSDARYIILVEKVLLFRHDTTLNYPCKFTARSVFLSMRYFIGLWKIVCSITFLVCSSLQKGIRTLPQGQENLKKSDLTKTMVEM